MARGDPSVDSIDCASHRAEASVCWEGSSIPSLRVSGCQLGSSALKVCPVLLRGSDEGVNWVVTGLQRALTSAFCFLGQNKQSEEL